MIYIWLFAFIQLGRIQTLANFMQFIMAKLFDQRYKHVFQAPNFVTGNVMSYLQLLYLTPIEMTRT